MLRITNPDNADAAKAYYAKADAGAYYAKEHGGDYVGEWQGKAAARLGLSGTARMEDFHALCDNRDPRTGEQLTVSNRESRRPLFDFTFSVPKSVAVMRGLFNDGRIEQAVMDSVNAVMEGVEAEMKTRVRREGKDEDRTVGNAVWLPFYHAASRPVDGQIDMGDHVHACLLNLCRDEEEGQWKAAQVGDIKASAPFWQAVWHADLARRLQALGVETERTKNAFEITGVSQDVIEEFSQRTAVIEEAAERLGITDADDKAELGAMTREGKRTDLSPEELREQWWERLQPAERAALTALHRQSLEREGRTATERNAPALAWALDHLLERESVVPEEKLLTEALKQGVGSVSLTGLQEAMAERGDLVRAEIDGRPMASTQAVIDEELAVLAFARNGRGRFVPLNADGPIRDEQLSEEQRRAVLHLWQARDPVMILRGQAGTGKTTMTKEAVRGIEEAGRNVVMLAPTAQASRGVLAEEGFADATTVAEFLLNEKLQEQARGNVVWIDEAGLMPFRDMTRLAALAEHLDARIVLSGDRRQHRAVARGEPLAVLEDLAGLPVAELTTIRRQQGAYRKAVERLARGDTEKGFEQLDALGAVCQMPEDDGYAPLVDAYMEALNDRKSVLVLSPTRHEGSRVTGQLRGRLKDAKKLGAEEFDVEQLTPLHLTEAEKRDPGRIAGTTAVFVKHAGKFRSGQRLEVTPERAAELAARPDAFTVYERSTLKLAAGDTIRITANGYTAPDRTSKKGHRLHNGSLYQVKEVTGNGVVLGNGWVLGKAFGHLAHGYVLTSHAGQGKTVDRVLVAASSASFPAANAREFYVDASRGRESVQIFTDDKEALRKAIRRDEQRPHALELVARNERSAERRQEPAGFRHLMKSAAERFRRWQQQMQRILPTPAREPAIGMQR